MGNGFKRFTGLTPLSLKNLNDQLEQLWLKVMGGIRLKDMDAGTQTSYARDIESDIGTLGRYTSANREAFELSNWSLNEQQTMNEQWNHVVELPEIPGGYYVSRNLDNAFRAVVLSGNDARESLFYWTSSTNEEIARKRHEMGLND